MPPLLCSGDRCHVYEIVASLGTSGAAELYPEEPGAMLGSMPLDLSPLFALSFLTADAARANAALDEARGVAGGRSYEVVVPPEPDLAWFEGALMSKLVYYCDATRAPLPACAGVFVSMFAGDRLYAVLAADVIAFACEVLEVSPEELVRRHGTGEVRHALPVPHG